MSRKAPNPPPKPSRDGFNGGRNPAPSQVGRPPVPPPAPPEKSK